MKKILFVWKRYSYLLLFVFIPLVALVDYKFGLVALLCIFLPIITSFFSGKFWCGNLCPRGNFFDQIISKFSENKKTPRIFQTMIFRISVVIMIIIYFVYEINQVGFSLENLGFLLCKFILITTIIAIVFTTFYNERTWCSFCPVGTIASLNSRLFNRFNKKRLLKVGNQCAECKLCETSCLMNIRISNYKSLPLDDINCLSCDKCQNVCPRNIIHR